MAYQIDRYDNSILVTVPDGTLDTTTDIKLIGKNYAGYGEIQNENFLYLLENFSGVVEPPRAISGQLWYDSGNGKIKFYDGTKFRAASGAEVSPVQPTGQVRGDLWWNSSSEELYVYNGTQYKAIGPLFAGFENTKLEPITLADTQSNEHTVIQAVVDNKVTFLISNDEFTINASTPVTGFTRVKKGISLVNTNEFGLSSDSYVFWGTASNSLKLGGVDASDYMTKNSTSFDAIVRFSDSGLSVGDSNDLVISIENDNQAVLQNTVGNSNLIKIKTNNSSGSAVHSVSFKSNGIEPATNDSFELGASATRWKNVYSVASDISSSLTVSGASLLNSLSVSGVSSLADLSVNGSTSLNSTLSVTGAVTLANDLELDGTATLNGSVVLGNTANDGIVFSGQVNSNVVPNSDAAFDLGRSDRRWNTIYTSTLDGVSTSAQYADLAEIYQADSDYEPGTVVKLGGSAEVTVTSEWADTDVFGVISHNPAYLMNSQAEGVPVALAGRVPVKVVGEVRKGQRLVSSSVPGHAEAVEADYDYRAVIGRSLEDSLDYDSNTVEAVVGVR